MSRPHSVYLSLGSNIDPEANLPRAIEMLGHYGHVKDVSSVWESHAVGAAGPNFLNASVLLETDIPPEELKDRLSRPIETAMGRVRTSDKDAPRPIDIDVMLVDGEASNLDRWDNAFVLLPIAELLPDAPHPITRQPLREAAEQARRETWIVERPGLLKSLS
jgi:2-amino-4-hydroxy-6-hydroxymethyldihydropteridine diphosphokinase